MPRFILLLVISYWLLVIGNWVTLRPVFAQSPTQEPPAVQAQADIVEELKKLLESLIKPKIEPYNQATLPLTQTSNITSDSQSTDVLAEEAIDVRGDVAHDYALSASGRTPYSATANASDWWSQFLNNIEKIVTGGDESSKYFASSILPGQRGDTVVMKDSFTTTQCAALPPGIKECQVALGPTMEPISPSPSPGVPSVTPGGPSITPFPTTSIAPIPGLVHFCQRDTNFPNSANLSFDTTAADGTQCTYLKGGCGIFTVAMILSTYKKDKLYYPDYVYKNYYAPSTVPGEPTPIPITGCETTIWQAKEILDLSEFNITTNLIFNGEPSTLADMDQIYRSQMINYLNSGSGILVAGSKNGRKHLWWIMGISQQGNSYIMTVMDSWYGCFKNYPLTETADNTIIISSALAFSP